MTIALAWLSDAGFGMIADSAVTLQNSQDASGPTSLGQQDRFSGYSVNEAALKIYEIGPGVVFTAAGTAMAIENAADALRSLVNANTPEAAVLQYQSEAATEGEFEGLLCHARGSEPRVIGFRPSGYLEILQGSPGYLGVGNLKECYSRIMGDFLNLLIAQKLSITEEVSLITGYIISQSMHEPLLADGIGGSIFSGAFYGGNWHWTQDTVFALASSSFFRTMSMGQQPSLALIDFIFCSVFNGIGLSYSTILTKEDPDCRIEVRLFQNKCSPAIKSWIDDSLLLATSRMWQPSRIVFISTDRPRSVGIVTDINKLGSPISISHGADGISISCTKQICEWLAVKLSKPQQLFMRKVDTTTR